MNPERMSAPIANENVERRSSAILSYLQKIVLKDYQPDAKQEEKLRKFYAERLPRERADAVYDKLMAYTVDKKELMKRKESFEPDLDLIREIKVLLEDTKTRRVFSQTYGEARVDANEYRKSDIGGKWRELNETIEQLEAEFKKTEQALFLKRLPTRSTESSTRSKAERLARELLELKSERDNLRSLKDQELTPENTDAAAAFAFETLTKYADQLKKGFVWLPSREKIHTDTVAALQNGRWPVLVGEAGTGKSDQADAAALELTGNLPTEVQCEQSTDKRELIADQTIDPETGGAYFIYGPLMSAFTGFEDSRQREPAYRAGRIVRFDESGRLGRKAYGEIKLARQKKPGDDFYGHPVLPGAASIWTTNPVGSRYPDRHPVDPAMRREIAEIYVDYPDQSSQSPELYEFAVAALLDQNQHIQVAEEELSPAYENKKLADDKKKPLVDGRIPVAEDVLIDDPTDSRHGVLWRLANAIKTLQNAFIYGNQKFDLIPADALRFTEDADGNITLGGTGGEPLTLSSSTMTLGELQSWMQGYRDRLQKQNKDFQVGTFSAWITLKLRTYLKQVDPADRNKIQAIFNHYHLFDPALDTSDATPITPRRIGYLSPRVPRPLYLEQPRPPSDQLNARPKTEVKPNLEAREITTKQVTLEDGSTVMIEEREYSEFIFDGEGNDHETWQIGLGRHFQVKDNSYTFAGTVEQEGSEHHGKLVGKLTGEALHQVFESEQVDRGVFVYDTDALLEDINTGIKSTMKVCWETTCKTGSPNNPTNVPPPTW